MRYLYKTCAVIAAIILIELLKNAANFIWPFRPFHALFTSLQLVLLLWLTVSLILDLTVFRDVPFRIAIQKSTLIVFLILIIPELILVFLLRHPKKIPKGILPMFQEYYDVLERDIIQFNPNCARYDSTLFYTLMPNQQFNFANREFDTDYSTNSKGLRDDEISLYKPDIVVLGDSYAMGWGVGQNETFAQQIEKTTGKKVLNAAISSYGTARELKNLQRLDTSQLQFLIIQYSNNDEEENKPFVTRNYQLLISSPAVYNNAVQSEYWRKQYFPGKHFTTIGKWYGKEKLQQIMNREVPVSPDSLRKAEAGAIEKAQNFIDILHNSSINFTKVKVIVIDMNDLASIDKMFIEKADSIQHHLKYVQRFKTNLLFLPVSTLLKSDDYYTLDPHLRASGHKKLASLITPYLSLAKPSFQH